VEKLRPTLGWFALVLLPLSSLWARLVAHPLHLRDPEFMMVPTAGREYAHGHLSDLIAHQINFETHHGYLTDALLAAAGFRVFGEHYLAWQWVPLLYAAVFVVASLSILQRTCGQAGAVAFCALFTAGPFLMKDGVLAMVGAHAAGAALMLAALALAMRCGSARRFDARAVAAGATIAAGAWYLPTVVIAAVPVFAATARCGGRRLRDVALGLAVVVPLWCATVAVQMGEHAGQPAGSSDSFGSALLQSLPSLRAASAGAESRGVDLGKLPDVVGWSVAGTLFAQPASLTDGVVPMHRGQVVLGRVWCLAWIAALVASVIAIVAAALRRTASRGPIGWDGALVLSLPLLYGAAYLLSPMAIEPDTRRLLERVQAPPIHVARYLVPLMMLWTVVAAQQLGNALRPEARPWIRVIALGITVALTIPGFVAAGMDLIVDRAPPGTLGQLSPSRYEHLFSAERGPTRDQHAQCRTHDPISRGNHLRCIGWFDRVSAEGLQADPSEVRRALDAVTRDLELDSLQRSFVAHGHGYALFGARTGDEDLFGLVAVAEAAASELTPLDALAYRYGSAEAAFPDICQGATFVELVERLCPVAGHDVGPLCAVAGRCQGVWGYGELPSRPSGLFPTRESMVEVLPAAIRKELVRGVAWNIGGSLPPSRVPPHPAGWSEAEWSGFTEGWKTGARHVWRWPGETYPVVPWDQP